MKSPPPRRHEWWGGPDVCHVKLQNFGPIPPHNSPGSSHPALQTPHSQNRLTCRHRNHYSHQNLRCSAYASYLLAGHHYPKTTPPLQPIPPPFNPLARMSLPLVRRKAMVCCKITYYKMLTSE